MTECASPTLLLLVLVFAGLCVTFCPLGFALGLLYCRINQKISADSGKNVVS